MIDSTRPRARDFVGDLTTHGRYHFTSADLRAALGVSTSAARQALRRLGIRGEVASPARGFHVVVPPEYRRIGCLPPDQFIPALMAYWNRKYYVGLLSAAQYHGAAHHRPQEFQVVVEKNRPEIACGSVRVTFVARGDIGTVPVREFNTPRGTVRVSTPEATAIDLVGYMRRSGGIDRVAGVLLELKEALDSARLVDAARCSSVRWAQRLGFLLDQIGATDKTALLKDYVKGEARNYTRLIPAAESNEVARSHDWRLYVNASVEPDA